MRREGIHAQGAVSGRLFSVATALVILQLLVLLVVTGSGDVTALRYAGFALWAIAIGFASLPIWTLSKYGDVPQGESYMMTTRLVTRGPYALVRHPQFLGALLLSVALVLVSQHALVICLGLFAVPTILAAGRAADEDALALFGAQYEAYMARVPRFNLLVGLLRRVR